MVELTYFEQLQFKELIFYFLNKKDYFEISQCCNLLTQIINFLSTKFSLSYCKLSLDDSDHRWAIYKPQEKEITLSRKLFEENSDFIVEILIHEWCHHWQIETNQIVVDNQKYKTLLEYDQLVHNTSWERQLNYFLNLIDIDQMKWIPLYRRKELSLVNT